MADITPELKCYVVQHDTDPDPTEVYFAKSHIEAKRWFAGEHGDGDKHIAGISAKRAKGWDQYAPGPVPKMEMIDAGWWMECHGCYAHIDTDAIGTSEPYTRHYTWADYALDREYGPDLTLPICDPYEPEPGAIWCCKACHDRDMAQRLRKERMETAARRIVEAYALKTWPGIEIVRGKDGFMRNSHVYVHRDMGYLLIHDVRIPITFPGAKYGNQVTVRDEKWRESYIIDGRPWTERDTYSTRTRQNRAPLSMRKRVTELWICNGDKEAWDEWIGSKSEVAA